MLLGAHNAVEIGWEELKSIWQKLWPSLKCAALDSLYSSAMNLMNRIMCQNLSLLPTHTHTIAHKYPTQSKRIFAFIPFYMKIQISLVCSSKLRPSEQSLILHFSMPFSHIITTMHTQQNKTKRNNSYGQSSRATKIFTQFPSITYNQVRCWTLLLARSRVYMNIYVCVVWTHFSFLSIFLLTY